MLFTEEVKTMDELVNKIANYNIGNGKIKVVVVCFVFDENNNCILQRRGPGARDEVGKIAAIGGSLNNQDNDFRDAMKRELIEEAGDKATIELGEFIGAQCSKKVDFYTNEMINWIILAYKGKLKNGELINMEPDKCICFEKAKLEDYKEEDLSETAKIFIDYMLKKDSLSN